MPYSVSDLIITDPAFKKLFITLLNLRSRVDSGFTYNTLSLSASESPPPVRNLSSLKKSAGEEPENLRSPLAADEVILKSLDNLLSYLTSLSFIDTGTSFQDDLTDYINSLNAWGAAFLPYYSTLSTGLISNAYEPRHLLVFTIPADALLYFILLMDNIRSYLDSRKLSNPALQSASFHNRLQQQLKSYADKAQTFEGTIAALNEKYINLEDQIQSITKARDFIAGIETVKAQIEAASDRVNTAATNVDNVNRVFESARQIIQYHEEKKDKYDRDLNSLSSRTEELLSKNNDLQSEIKDLLKGAVKVTLARDFQDKSSSLQQRQKKWYITLFVDLALILAWNFFHLSPSFYGTWVSFTPGITAPDGSVNLWLNFLYTEVTGLPLFWLAWLATTNIRATFKLMEDYDYKATAAKTYVGYRDEALDLEKGEDSQPLKKKVFTTVIDRLEEHPLRVMDRHLAGSPLHELIELLLSPRVQKILSDTGQEGADYVKELIKESLNEQHKKAGLPESASSGDSPESPSRGKGGAE